jgi:hypothetical protein
LLLTTLILLILLVVLIGHLELSFCMNFHYAAYVVRGSGITSD